MGPSFHKIELVKERIAKQFRISNEAMIALENFELERRIDQMIGDAIYEVRYWFLSKHETVEEDPYPATWWDHCKDTYRSRWWFPRWLKPPVYRKIATKIVNKVCPHMNADAGDRRPHLEFFLTPNVRQEDLLRFRGH